jgi:5'-nucleotidase
VTSVSDESGPIRVAGGENPDAVEEDEFFLTNVVEPIAEGLSGLEANIIAETQVALDGRRSSVRSRETNQGNLIADAFLWQANQLHTTFGAPAADIAVANGGGIRNDNVISAGDISELTTFDMLPFLNFVSIVEGLTPERFKEMMENAVSRISLDGGVPVASGGGTGRYAQFAGFSMEFNPDLQALEYDENGDVATPGQRVIDLILDDGTAIVQNGVIQPDAPSVNLATADFTARGGDQYPTGDLDLTLVGVTYQQALFNYLTAPASAGGLEGVVSSAEYPEGGEGRAVVTDRTPVNNEINSALPSEFSLSQNYPNPFNPSTNIKFDLPQSAQVRLEVYNMLGQRVATLVDNRMEAGFHEVNFDARNLASGMYLYRIEAGSFSSIKKMMLIK